MPKMIDVFQKYQGAIDWPQVYADDVRDVVVKVTNGVSPASPAADSYVESAHGVGMRTGGYAYLLGAFTPESQADAFAAELLRLRCLDLAPTADYEDPSLPRDLVGAQAWIERFFARLLWRIPWLSKVLLYSSGSELQGMHAQSITVAGLSILDWDAEYGPNDGSEHPIVHYTGTVAVHQFTSVGRLAGIAGPVDLDDDQTDITEPGGSTMDEQTIAAAVWGFGFTQIMVGDGKGGSTTDGHSPAGNALASLWSNTFFPTNNYANLEAIEGMLTRQNAQLAALTGAVAALTQANAANQPITPTQLATIVDQAVAQHIQITGTVQVTPAPPAAPAVPVTAP